MAYHDWGDGFDFHKLDDAMHFIYKASKAFLGMGIMMKEKYGTIRYEMFHGYGSIRGLYFIQRFVFECILFVACIKFYSHRAEILDDILADYDGRPWFAVLFIKENPWKKS